MYPIVPETKLQTKTGSSLTYVKQIQNLSDCNTFYLECFLNKWLTNFF